MRAFEAVSGQSPRAEPPSACEVGLTLPARGNRGQEGPALWAARAELSLEQAPCQRQVGRPRSMYPNSSMPLSTEKLVVPAGVIAYRVPVTGLRKVSMPGA